MGAVGADILGRPHPVGCSSVRDTPCAWPRAGRRPTARTAAARGWMSSPARTAASSAAETSNIRRYYPMPFHGSLPDPPSASGSKGPEIAQSCGTSTASQPESSNAVAATDAAFISAFASFAKRQPPPVNAVTRRSFAAVRRRAHARGALRPARKPDVVVARLPDPPTRRDNPLRPPRLTPMKKGKHAVYCLVNPCRARR